MLIWLIVCLSFYIAPKLFLKSRLSMVMILPFLYMPVQSSTIAFSLWTLTIILLLSSSILSVANLQSLPLQRPDLLKRWSKRPWILQKHGDGVNHELEPLSRTYSNTTKSKDHLLAFIGYFSLSHSCQLYHMQERLNICFLHLVVSRHPVDMAFLLIPSKPSANFIPITVINCTGIKLQENCYIVTMHTCIPETSQESMLSWLTS